MFDKYKDYKDIKMPEDIKNSILENMQEYKPANVGANNVRPRSKIKHRILIYADLRQEAFALHQKK